MGCLEYHQYTSTIRLNSLEKPQGEEGRNVEGGYFRKNITKGERLDLVRGRGWH